MTAALLIRSPWIGDVEWDPGCELAFPAGLPGFENERRMIPVEIPSRRPLVYLQSLENPDVCFVCLPVLTIDSDFRLEMSEEEMATLLLPDRCVPEIGADVLCLGLLIPAGNTVHANLSAPIVINLHNGCGVQCLPRDGSLSRFRLGEAGMWERLC
jgi:flagellar assembly factor FliW